MSSFIPAFRLNLGHPVLSGLATIGRFDGIHPSLAFATTNDTILIHSPHDQQQSDPSDSTSAVKVRTLAINRQITSITSGCLASSLAITPIDQLFIGGNTSLLCYDVESNKDIFYQDIKDGVHTLAVGRVTANSLASPTLCLIGGNSAVAGVDMMGIESYWTAISDSVSAICVRDMTNSSTDKDKPIGGLPSSQLPSSALSNSSSTPQQLIVGSNDSIIRIFSADEMIVEVHEAAAIRHLVALSSSSYAFSLNNGTVGVYNNQHRLWLAKSKHKITALAAFDLDGDGLLEVITGWSHGRLEVRHQATGELIYKDKFTSAVAALLIADYRNEGKQNLIAITVDGEIRGYLPVSESGAGYGKDDAGNTISLADDEIIAAQQKGLNDRKNDLLTELRNYETALATAANTGDNKSKNNTSNNNSNIMTGADINGTSMFTSPALTQLSYSIKPNKGSQSLLLTVQTNNDCVIKVMVIFADHLFGPNNESRCIIPNKDKQSNVLSIPLKSTKNIPLSIRLKIIVGHRGLNNDHIFEYVENLPKFHNFLYCKPRDMSSLIQPKGNVMFRTTERANRLVLWLNSAFLLDTNPGVTGTNNTGPSPLVLSVNSDTVIISFLHLLSNSPLIIKMTPDHGGTVTIKTDHLDLAGELLTDFCRYCKITTLESICEFHEDFSVVEKILESIQEYNATRIKMSGDMGEMTQHMKMSVIKAEDARLLNHIDLMAKYYSQVITSNNECLAEYQKRELNQKELMEHLKNLNQYIQKIGAMRVGEAKTRVIAACRAAIKDNNSKALIKIMRVGQDRE